MPYAVCSVNHWTLAVYRVDQTHVILFGLFVQALSAGVVSIHTNRKNRNQVPLPSVEGSLGGTERETLMKSEETVTSRDYYHALPVQQITDLWEEGVQWVPWMHIRINHAMANRLRCQQGVPVAHHRAKLTVWFVRADSAIGRALLEERQVGQTA